MEGMARRAEKTAAVVVTYNRLELLKRNIEALLAQTAACDILLVDNASTDGTGEAMRALEQAGKIQYRNTGANLGGAGGFNYGMRWAVEAGYDYVWVMDDDTLPHPDALEKLLEADRILGGHHGWLSSKCLWTDGSICPMNRQRVSPYKEISLTESDSGILPAQMASFVSLFLRREMILKYGLPIRDFFIWTDDWEYTRRISRNERCYVIGSSTIIHAMKNKTIVNIATDTPDRLPRYQYFYRNDVYLYRREGLRGWIWLIAKDCWHSLQVIRAGKFIRLRVIWSGFLSGCSFFPEAETCEVQYESIG